MGVLASDWNYEAHFFPKGRATLHPVVDEVERYISEIGLENHPFFDRARGSRDLLRLWVSQELVMTNAFAQIVLMAASREPNVHVRAILAEVAWGEHHRCRSGVAPKAHPWLLDGLRRSIGLLPNEVRPATPTVAFIHRLEIACTSTLEAIAAIGVGNERLIAPEYEAVRSCFKAQWPDADFEPFLEANITEDRTHSRLCYEAASILISAGASADAFYDAAVGSIDSRVTYFDELAALL